jgi:hypothetical protein
MTMAYVVRLVEPVPVRKGDMLTVKFTDHDMKTLMCVEGVVDRVVVIANVMIPLLDEEAEVEA